MPQFEILIPKAEASQVVAKFCGIAAWGYTKITAFCEFAMYATICDVGRFHAHCQGRGDPNAPMPDFGPASSFQAASRTSVFARSTPTLASAAACASWSHALAIAFARHESTSLASCSK
jgi:hypothetical protein